VTELAPREAPWLLPAFAVLFGLVWGSFLNVVIHRLPLGLSLVSPRSRCPSCGKPVAAYDNVPLLSYVVLGGRCRNCKWLSVCNGNLRVRAERYFNDFLAPDPACYLTDEEIGIEGGSAGAAEAAKWPVPVQEEGMAV